MSKKFNLGRLIGEFTYEIADDHESTIQEWLKSSKTVKELNDRIVAIQSALIDKADIDYVNESIGSIKNGLDGKSAYDLALLSGFDGTEEEWLKSLKGDKGKDGADGISIGLSTIEIEGGHRVNITDYKGTTTFDIMNGEKGSDGLDGLSAYEIAVGSGYKGTVQEWLEYLKGKDGLSAYDVAVKNGYVGTEAEWLASLKNDKGGSVVIENGKEHNSNNSYRIQWLTQAEYNDLQFSNRLNPKVEYHITDKPTSYSLQLVGTELHMKINNEIVATCSLESLIKES